MSHRRLSSRDYKSVRRGGLDLARLRDLGTGFGAGLLLTLVVYVSDHRSAPGAADGAAGSAAGSAPTPRHADIPGTVAGADEASGSYDFYEGLPKFEVVVPERERGTHVDAAARIERPGTYFLQAGSYRNAADADRVQAQLARQSISANVQRVALDNDV